MMMCNDRNRPLVVSCAAAVAHFLFLIPTVEASQLAALTASERATLESDAPEVSPGVVTTEAYEGKSVVNGVQSGICSMVIKRAGDGTITYVSVAGTANRTHGAFSRSPPELAGTSIVVSTAANVEGWWELSNFSSVPSLAHIGYTRIALLKRWSTFDNPWPGIHEVRYVVQRDNFKQMIAHNALSMVTPPFTLESDHLECRELQRTNE